MCRGRSKSAAPAPWTLTVSVREDSEHRKTRERLTSQSPKCLVLIKDFKAVGCFVNGSSSPKVFAQTQRLPCRVVTTPKYRKAATGIIHKTSTTASFIARAESERRFTLCPVGRKDEYPARLSKSFFLIRSSLSRRDTHPLPGRRAPGKVGNDGEQFARADRLRHMYLEA